MTGVTAAATVERLRTTFESGRTRDLEWRRSQLGALSRMLSENESAILDALATDLGKPRFESWAGDVQAGIKEADHLRRHLRSRAATTR